MMTTIANADWKEDANARIEKIRKGDFVVRLTDSEGKPLANTAVKIHQTRSDFQFGTAIAEHLIGTGTVDSQRYEKFVLDHFNTVVCENAMKWYAVEKKPGERNFDPADRQMKFAEDHGLNMRGHCLFWSRVKFVQPWVQELSAGDLRSAVDAHLESVVTRYKNRVESWDVNNEMLDGSFYQERLGQDVRAHFFKKAHELDPHALLFVNEYSVIDNDGKLERYISLIKDLQKQGAPVSGIGVQEHGAERFAGETVVDPEHPERGNVGKMKPEDVLRRLDKLGELNLPIHLTEISFRKGDQNARAEALDTFYRLAFSHPKVEAFLVWGFWENAHWLGKDAALVDKDWNLLPAGKQLEKLLLEEWRTNLEAKTDAEGKLNFRGFFGTYEISANDQKATVTLKPGTGAADASLKPK